jgi:hypothetical protein
MTAGTQGLAGARPAWAAAGFRAVAAIGRMFILDDG